MMVLYGTYLPDLASCQSASATPSISPFTYKANRLARREDRFWEQWTLSRDGGDGTWGQLFWLVVDLPLYIMEK